MKIALVNALSAARLPLIEVTAFVSPTWVPQMADADVVAAGIERHPGIRYSALVPNMQGLERAQRAAMDEIAILSTTSEAFSRRNTNASIDEALKRTRDVIASAAASGQPVRGYLSTAFGCPFEGAIPPSRTVEGTLRLLDVGVYEVAVSDTIGVAHPGQVRALLDVLLSRVPAERIALHLHDTWGMAIANVAAALEYGVTTFDAAAGGLGGCPFAPGAAGNLSTEDLLYLLDGLGFRTGVDAGAVAAASAQLETALSHSLPSRALAAWRAARPIRHVGS
jgi:hydroxymethylglutaryl-CoA lyase